MLRPSGPRDLPCVDARQHAADCAAGYEALRAQIMGVATPASPHGMGLGLLLQHGVAAWVETVRTVMRRPPPPSRPMAEDPDTAQDTAQDASHPRACAPGAELIPATQHGDVVTLLAGLVLSARPARHDPARCSGVSV